MPDSASPPSLRSTFAPEAFAGRAAAWAVHFYTASGALFALAALAATARGDVRQAFFWLAAQVFVDSTDGWLARFTRVSERVPSVNGARLDDIVDYLTYVFVPAWMVVRLALVPPGSEWIVAGAMLLSSALGFSREDAKTSDHYFTGFPSYWNVAVFYAVLLGTAPSTNAAFMLALAALVFVPIRYVYPSRTVTLQPLTLALSLWWGVTTLAAMLVRPPAPRWLVWASLVFPAYYVLLSLALEVRRRAGAR
jgi:phosphatidylcholine synthase